MHPANWLCCLCLIAVPAVAQQINIPAELADEAALPRLMPPFAKAVIGEFARAILNMFCTRVRD
jgi:hypothetical protein